MLWWMKYMFTGENGYDRLVNVTWGKDYISWYSTVTGVNGPEYFQLNALNKEYYYYSFS